MIEVISKMNGQVAGMISGIVKELVSPIVIDHYRMGEDTYTDEDLFSDSEEEVYSICSKSRWYTFLPKVTISIFVCKNNKCLKYGRCIGEIFFASICLTL